MVSHGNFRQDVENYPDFPPSEDGPSVSSKELLTYLKLTGVVAQSVVVHFGSRGPEIDPRVRHILSWKKKILHQLIQKEKVVGYWQNNGHLILVNCLRKASQEQCG